MADTIFLSDEYSWTASSGLFDLVLELLADRVADQATREQLATVREHHLGAVDVRRLPAAGRAELLRAIREDLVAAVAASPKLTSHEEVRRGTIGHVKVLRLIADDLARSAEPPAGGHL